MSKEKPGETGKWKPFVPTIDAQNPWPGLAPYPTWAAPFFHGREEEIQELLRLVRREDLAIVHGKSGIGKTSLIQAGVIPELAAEDCMPVLIRLDHAPEAPALVDQVKHAITQTMILSRVDGPTADGEQTLWDYFHRRNAQFWGPRNRLLTPVLIFNQFEELFSLGCASDETRQRTNDFLPHLIDLIDNRQPLDVRRRLLDGSAESTQWNFEDSGCKVVLCVRKDYVTDLDWLALRALSDEKRLALGMLRGDHAVDAVARAGAAVLDLGTAEKIVRFCADSSTAVDVASSQSAVSPNPAPAGGNPGQSATSNPATAGDTTASSIQSSTATAGIGTTPRPPLNPASASKAPIPKVTPRPASRKTTAASPTSPGSAADDVVVATPPPPPTATAVSIAPTPGPRLLAKLEVEPALLSLVCRELNAVRQRLGLSHIDPEQLRGTPADFLKTYYDRCMSDMPAAMRLLVEDWLVTKLGNRRQFVLEDALAMEGVTADAIRTLVDRQLLRVDDRLGTTRLELSHNLLVETVRHSRDERIAAEEAAMLEQIRKDYASRIRRERFVVAAGLVVCVIAILYLAALVVTGWHQRDKEAARRVQAEKDLIQSKAETEAARKDISAAEAVRIALEKQRDSTAVALAAAQAEKLESQQQADKAKAEREAAIAEKEKSDLAVKALQEKVALDSSREALSKAEEYGHDGDLLQQKGEGELAMAAFIKELNGLSKLDPVALATERVQRMIADTDEKLGNLAIARNDPPAAQKYLQAAQASLDYLSKGNPNDLDLRRRSLAISKSLGELLRNSNALATRRKCLLDGLDAAKKFLKLAPSDAQALGYDCYFATELGAMDLTVPQGEPSARAYFADAANSWNVLFGVKPNPQTMNNVLWFSKYLGDASLKAGDNRGAANWYEFGLGLLEKSAAPPDAQPWNDLSEFRHGQGVAHYKLNELAAARIAFESEESIRRTDSSPANLQKLWTIYDDLAGICASLHDYPAARHYLEERLRLAGVPPKDRSPELTKIYAALGDACMKTDDFDAARKAFQEGLKFEPRNVALRRGLADVDKQIGESKARAHQTTEARALLEEASVIYGELNALNPRDAVLRQATLSVYQQLGDMALLRGDAKSSQNIYKQYVTIIEEDAKIAPNPKDADQTENLLVGYEGLGDASIEIKDHETTNYCFDQYKQVISSRLSGDKSGLANYSLAVAYRRLAVLRDKLNDADARRDFDTAIKTLEELPDAVKNMPESKGELSLCLGKLASIYMRTNSYAAAVDTYRRAVEVDEKQSSLYPSNSDLMRNASDSNIGLADAILLASGVNSAKAYYEHGLELARSALKLADGAESKTESEKALAKSLRQCGYMSLQPGAKDTAAAAKYYQDALSIDDRLSTADPQDSALKMALARDYIGVGDAAAATDPKAAIASFSQARDIIAPLRAATSVTGKEADDLFQKIEPRLKAVGQ